MSVPEQRGCAYMFCSIFGIGDDEEERQRLQSLPVKQTLSMAEVASRLDVT